VILHARTLTTSLWWFPVLWNIFLLYDTILSCSSPAKLSTMDIIPTSLIIPCKSFSEIIVRLANLSFSEGKFPSTFKQATVIQLIKGHSIDNLAPSNYRPISNFSFISKILERLFLARFQSHILNSSNCNQYQSAYRPGCSTETALQKFSSTAFTAQLMRASRPYSYRLIWALPLIP